MCVARAGMYTTTCAGTGRASRSRSPQSWTNSIVFSSVALTVRCRCSSSTAFRHALLFLGTMLKQVRKRNEEPGSSPRTVVCSIRGASAAIAAEGVLTSCSTDSVVSEVRLNVEGLRSPRSSKSGAAGSSPALFESLTRSFVPVLLNGLSVALEAALGSAMSKAPGAVDTRGRSEPAEFDESSLPLRFITSPGQLLDFDRVGDTRGKKEQL
mmetsp:Transcript_57424/g.159833  ORF Transcript_57424/g.159833 Transcript_57424/m.159833 type:complete len:211 (-) Transcript_57424:584-1216(-)